MGLLPRRRAWGAMIDSLLLMKGHTSYPQLQTGRATLCVCCCCHCLSSLSSLAVAVVLVVAAARCLRLQLECTFDRIREVVAARLWRLLVVESRLLEHLHTLKRDYLLAQLPAVVAGSTDDIHVTFEAKSPLHLDPTTSSRQQMAPTVSRRRIGQPMRYLRPPRQPEQCSVLRAAKRWRR